MPLDLWVFHQIDILGFDIAMYDFFILRPLKIVEGLENLFHIVNSLLLVKYFNFFVRILIDNYSSISIDSVLERVIIKITEAAIFCYMIVILLIFLETYQFANVSMV